MFVSPCITSVICDTSGSWVAATVSVSMLQWRAANRPATRTSAPDSFCSRIDSVCFMAALRLSFRHVPETNACAKTSVTSAFAGVTLLKHVGGLFFRARRCCARSDELPGDHLRIGRARPHHWIHAGVGIDHHLEERRPLLGKELGDRAFEFFLAFQPPRPTETVGLGGLDEILAVEAFVGGRETMAEVKLLPLPYHAVPLVVQHHDFQRQAVGGDGFQLAEVHAD